MVRAVVHEGVLEYQEHIPLKLDVCFGHLQWRTINSCLSSIAVNDSLVPRLHSTAQKLGQRPGNEAK